MAYRWKEISESLRSSIESGELKPGDRLPPDTELAVRYRVSKMTVYRAMDDLRQQGLVARKRRLGSVVAAPADRKQRSSGQGYRVAMLLSRPHDFPQASYLGGFRDALPDDCDLLLCDTGNEPEREATYLERMRDSADGIACFPSGDPANTELLRDIIADGKPLVCLDRLPEGLKADAVFTDNYASTRTALQHLVERGHRRIGFVTTDNFGISSVQERRDAWREVLHAAGGPDSETSMTILPCIGGTDFEAFAARTYLSLRAQFADSAPPTALFCLEDYCLAATLEACQRLGKRVPHDVEIVSFSDIPALTLRATNQHVHQITQHAREMGQMAAERLMRRMAGEEMPTEVVRVKATFVPAKLLSPRTAPVLLPT